MNRTSFDNRLPQASKDILAKAKGRKLLSWSGSDSNGDMTFSLAGLHFDGFDCVLRIREPASPSAVPGDVYLMDVLEADSRAMPSPAGFSIGSDGSQTPCVWSEFPVGKIVREILVYVDPKGGGEWKIGGRFVSVDDACGIAFVFDGEVLLFEKEWVGTDLWTVSEAEGKTPAFQARNLKGLICERM